MASILKTNDNSNEKNVDETEVGNETFKTFESFMDDKNISTETKPFEPLKHKDDAQEDTEFIQKLEASSKGMIKGSLIVNYFKMSKRPFCLVFLILSFLLAQILASGADIFVSSW